LGNIDDLNGNIFMNPIILKYLEQYPDAPNRTLAKLILEENPQFGTIEKVRDRIRSYKGAHGNKDFKYLSNKSFVTNKSTIQEGLEKLKIFSHNKEMENIHLTDGRYLVLSDIHIPYHDMDSLTTALEWGLNNDIDCIILNGDIMDCYPVSSFIKEVGMPSLREEIEMTQAFFSYLRELFPIIPIYYKLGNHEERVRNYLLRNAKEFSDVDNLKFENLLSLDAFKIKLVNREIIKLGKLNVLHGHEMGESVFSPVNPARGMFLKAKSSTLFGHNHQVSHHSENNINGESTGVWSMGCLCTLSPDYRPYAYTKWSHGFACVDVNEDLTFHVNNMKIIGGKII
jgi:predicted phosphodiesterase